VTEGWPSRLIGQRLRSARRDRGLTLDAAAAAAGYTKSFLSAVERGETSPSIGSLYRICEVLGLAMAELFEAADRPESNVIRRADLRPRYLGGHGVANYLLSPASERRAQLIEVRIEPDGSPGPEFWSHRGDIVIATVVTGLVEFRFAHSTVTLRSGDTITYPPTEPHTWRNPDPGEPAVALFFQLPAEY
jgi:transcriptional regulator with XRE-family HTH domain